MGTRLIYRQRCLGINSPGRPAPHVRGQIQLETPRSGQSGRPAQRANIGLRPRVRLSGVSFLFRPVEMVPAVRLSGLTGLLLVAKRTIVGVADQARRFAVDVVVLVLLFKHFKI